ncbi:MAG TPA: flagellar type III secretion system pore protein FliP [Blastocatellia bacterium]|nr:flagellar type III secretion system pore protein FliP [Blastocatellia bacterium]
MTTTKPSNIRTFTRKAIAVSLPLLIILVIPVIASAADSQNLNIKIDGAGSGTGTSLPIQIVGLLTLLTFIPALLISLTCFTRLIVVFHFLRQALGTQDMPNNQVLLGLALILTMFVMAPTADQISSNAITPMMKGEIDQSTALERAAVPLRQFMLRYTREKDLALFTELAKIQRPETPDEVPLRVLAPAFMISELKTAFQIGFVLFLPFLVIDLVVSSVLLSMGMMQLPPVLISTPFKILLFVLVDGWGLVIGSLIRSYS